MSHPILKVLGSDGCQCYLLGCRETRRALVVDPKVGQEATLTQLVQAYGLTLEKVVDTHTHADHLSASAALLERGIDLAMSTHTACARPKRALADGDEVEVGSLRFRVFEVPGHTPDSIALYGHGLVLTGDSLLVGGLARADFHGSDPALLFESVRERLMTLPPETLVFPGHGYSDLLFSTIGRERETNAALRHASGADYAEALGVVEGAGNTPAVDEMLALNLSASPDLPDTPKIVAACASPGDAKGRERIPETRPEERRDDFRELGASSRWIDVRDPYEFAQGHIPGTENIPLGELGFHLEELRGRPRPLYVNCRSGVRSMTACRTLKHLGVVAEPVNVGGGILRWQELGYPIAGVPVS